MDAVIQRSREWSAEDHHASFCLSPGETLAGMLDLYDQAAKEADSVIAEIPDLGQTVPVPQGMAWFPVSYDSRNGCVPYGSGHRM